VIDRAGEHAPELRSAHAPLERGGLRRRLGDGRLVVLRRPEIEQDRGVLDVACQLLEAADLLLEPRALARDGLGLLLVVPEARGERLLLEPLYLCLELRQVKDAPLAP
jgi:hypothetical protein